MEKQTPQLEPIEASESQRTDSTKGTAIASAPPRDFTFSRPLIPLVPAQRRTHKGTELGVKHSFSGTKVRQGSEILKPTARYARAPWAADTEIRGRHSAPWQSSQTLLHTDLRESKSAPDLREPVLAAIRGLQDGSIQVDFRTRAKIAHAARRVLKSRESQRQSQQPEKASQGRDSKAHSGAFGNVAGRPPRAAGRVNLGPACATSIDSEEMSSSRVDGDPRRNDYDLQIESRAGQDVVMTGQGQPQPPEIGQRRSYPFTVTTGVPNFAQGGLQQVLCLSQARSRSTPSTGLQTAIPTCSGVDPHTPAMEDQLL